MNTCNRGGWQCTSACKDGSGFHGQPAAACHGSIHDKLAIPYRGGTRVGVITRKYGNPGARGEKIKGTRDDSAKGQLCATHIQSAVSAQDNIASKAVSSGAGLDGAAIDGDGFIAHGYTAEIKGRPVCKGGATRSGSQSGSTGYYQRTGTNRGGTGVGIGRSQNGKTRSGDGQSKGTGNNSVQGKLCAINIHGAACTEGDCTRNNTGSGAGFDGAAIDGDGFRHQGDILQVKRSTTGNGGA